MMLSVVAVRGALVSTSINNPNQMNVKVTIAFCGQFPPVHCRFSGVNKCGILFRIHLCIQCLIIGGSDHFDTALLTISSVSMH